MSAQATPFDLGAHLDDAEARLAKIAELAKQEVAADPTAPWAERFAEIKRLAEGKEADE